MNPGWWATQGITSGTNSNDYAAANQGQAKNMALSAVYELDNDLSQFGVQGGPLDTLANTLLTSDTSGQATDYAVINLGQLKNLVKPIYDQLLSIGYTQGPLASGTYPWLASGHGAANDYAAANIGQLKNLFYFDVTSSSSGALIPDWWLAKYGITESGTAIQNTNVPWSGGQITYTQAYQNGYNPIDYYNGLPPVLAIVSGNGQVGLSGSFAPAALVVSITDTNGAPLTDAPVTFAVPSGSGGQVQRTNLTSPASSVTSLTDSSGNARAYFILPDTPSTTGTVNVTAGTGTGVTFTESSDDGTSGATYRSPFAVTNVIGDLHPDGSEDLTWQNNVDPSDTTPIPIWHWNISTSAWFQVDSVPGGTSSYHVRANPTPMP